MPDSLSAFYFENAAHTENVKVAVSARFTDADGAPVLWELRPVSPEEDDAIRKSCTIVKQTRNGTVKDFRRDDYVYMAVARSVVFPDLANKELQNSWKVMGEAALLKKMLTQGELTKLLTHYESLNGLDKTFDEMVDDVKN